MSHTHQVAILSYKLRSSISPRFTLSLMIDDYFIVRFVCLLYLRMPYGSMTDVLDEREKVE